MIEKIEHLQTLLDEANKRIDNLLCVFTYLEEKVHDLDTQLYILQSKEDN